MHRDQQHRVYNPSLAQFSTYDVRMSDCRVLVRYVDGPMDGEVSTIVLTKFPLNDMAGAYLLQPDDSSIFGAHSPCHDHTGIAVWEAYAD